MQSEFEPMLETAREAELHVYTKPMYCALLCRKSLEELVRWIYDNDKDITLPYDTTLNSLMHDPSFKAVVPQPLWNNINVLRKIGNNAVHTSEKTDSKKSLAALKYLFDFSLWTVRMYSRSLTPLITFDESLLPKAARDDKTKKELVQLSMQFEQSQQQLQRANEELLRNQHKLKELEERLDVVHQAKQAHKNIPVSLSISEKETRLLYIDVLLREAGWDPESENVAEFEVYGMPNSQGIGYADYVLWGDDGKPLAVVEAKKTMIDPHKGQHQAELYANCLEKQFGQRPIIFYTNGFDTHIWDDSFYPPRRVYGFYTKPELELLINRRATRKSLTSQPINKEIAGRYYQETAIKRVCETLEKKQMGALLVMATGSGKTRTAAAIVDLLTKANWAKKILFLADRNALVTQAKNAFNQYLPNLTAIDLTKEEEDTSSRIVFSTYPTMMNRIDTAKVDGHRYYGVGHFDVVIIDEAHRSVYQKYKAIFEYFDAILIGLTATPKADADKDTYELFGLEPHNPTFAYELEEAVKDKYLVPPKAYPLPLKFPRQGIKYSELSEEEKAEFEEEFRDNYGYVPEEVSSSAVNTWLFNKDTVNKVLDILMEHGLMVEGGDKIGKSIIFAKNHTHAAFIRECFNERYPQSAGKALRIIDNYEKYAQNLLNQFSDPAKDPQIAVSVDMLDTGIDIPEIVNLVLFKPVRSKAKFWQMIGRGTRLCKDIFGVGFDKENFMVFDVCGNLEFFSAEMEETKGKSIGSLSQQIFKAKLHIATMTLTKYQGLEELQSTLLDELHGIVSQMTPEDDFRVKMEYRHVEKYRHRIQWNGLPQLSILEIEKHLSHLYLDEESDESARRFDLLMLNLQVKMLESLPGQQYYQKKVQALSSALLRKTTIPAVKAREVLLEAMAGDEFWQELNPVTLNDHRLALRDLIKFIDKADAPVLYTNFADELIDEIREHDFKFNDSNLEPYRKRIEKFIRDNQGHITIHRIKNNKPITRKELGELEKLILSADGSMDKKKLEETLAGEPLIKFIRRITGLDITAAKEAFSEFLHGMELSADQQTFINRIIDFLSVQGTIDTSMLFGVPFTEINHEGITGVFPMNESTKVIDILQNINANATRVV
ncbi:MAG: DEAD/DEAH box helicase family protein [Ferruginibacter sp.]